MISRFHRQKVTAGNCWSGHHHPLPILLIHLLLLFLHNHLLFVILPLLAFLPILLPPFTFPWSLSGPIPGNLNQLGQAEASLPSFPPFRFRLPPPPTFPRDASASKNFIFLLFQFLWTFIHSVFQHFASQFNHFLGPITIFQFVQSCRGKIFK